jgi:hypothetical protein
VLVVFAEMTGTPTKTSAGKVKKLPPPATELSVPPSTAAMNRIAICGSVINNILGYKRLSFL